MIVFADTSALVSLFDSSDANHKKAALLAEKLSGQEILISNYVFAEVVAVLSQKVGKEKAMYAGEYMQRAFVKISVDKDVEEIAWELFKAQTSKNVSFIDCTIFALFKKNVFEKAFAFDADFKKNKVPVIS